MIKIHFLSFFLSSQSAVCVHACALVVYRVCKPPKIIGVPGVCPKKKVYLGEHGYALEESLARMLPYGAQKASVCLMWQPAAHLDKGGT